MFGFGRRTAAISIARMRELLSNMEALEHSRAAFKTERSVYLAIVSLVGRENPTTKAAEDVMVNALNAVYGCDAKVIPYLSDFQMHVSLIDRFGTPEEKALVTIVIKKLADLGADDGRLELPG